MSSQIPKYLVIEGPIGVGKTSLAKKLAEEFSADLMLEEIDDNPFLEQFYQRPREAALSTQLYFLLQRAKQIKRLRQSDIFSPTRVTDYLIEKDQLFAQVNLSASEYELYLQVYEHMMIDSPTADLVVYLQAPIPTLLHRIKKRGRGYERFMEASYLEQLNEAYAEFFYHYDRSPLLIVNASEIDFINNDNDYQLLLDRILNTGSGRHYFNPLPFVS